MHADYIDLLDYPQHLHTIAKNKGVTCRLDIEAKNAAILKLQHFLDNENNK